MPTLAIHTGGIGDFLLACPALQELATSDALELAGIQSRLELAVAGGIARAAHELDAIEFHTVFAEPSPRLRAVIQEFDRVIVWMRDADGAIARGLHNCGAPRADIFAGLPDVNWTRHASDYYATCLGFGELPPLRLAIPPNGPPLDVVLHPGSGSEKKNWPIEKFRSIADRFASEGRRVTWCLGPAEIERNQDRELEGEVLRCESLVELASRLVTARFYAGNDSGITHLSAALGVPTAVIFQSTDPKIWAPRGEHVCVMRARHDG